VLIHMNHFLSGTELNEDYRIMSGSHLDNAETAKKSGVRTLVLTHLQPDLDNFGVKEKMVSEIATIFPGNVVVRSDLRVRVKASYLSFFIGPLGFKDCSTPVKS